MFEEAVLHVETGNQLEQGRTIGRRLKKGCGGGVFDPLPFGLFDLANDLRPVYFYSEKPKEMSTLVSRSPLSCTETDIRRRQEVWLNHRDVELFCTMDKESAEERADAMVQC